MRKTRRAYASTLAISVAYSGAAAKLAIPWDGDAHPSASRRSGFVPPAEEQDDERNQKAPMEDVMRRFTLSALVALTVLSVALSNPMQASAADPKPRRRSPCSCRRCRRTLRCRRSYASRCWRPSARPRRYARPPRFAIRSARRLRVIIDPSESMSARPGAITTDAADNPDVSTMVRGPARKLAACGYEDV